VFDLLGERYQGAVTKLDVARLAAETGSRRTARQYLDVAVPVFETLGAHRDLDDVRAVRALLEAPAAAVAVSVAADADDAIVTRLVDAAIVPPLLAAETTAALVESTTLDAAAVFTVGADGPVELLSFAGCDVELAERLPRWGRRAHAIR